MRDENVKPVNPVKLAMDINAYWAARGFDAGARVVAESGVPCLKTNLVNGIPPRSTKAPAGVVIKDGGVR